MRTTTPRFSLYDNGGRTVDRYTLVDTHSADIMNGETYMQTTTFSANFDTPLGVISHDAMYPEDLPLLGEHIEDPKDLPTEVREAVRKIRKAYYN